MPSSFSEANEARVLDAVALGGRGREEDALGELLFGLELDFVVGPGQHPDPLRGVLILLRHSVRQAELFGLQAGAKFFERERLPEFVHHPAREFARQSQFCEFSSRTAPFRIRGFGICRGSVRKPAGREDLDPLIGMDDAGSERDGRNVPFPGGAQAENEAQRAGRQAGLIGVRNDRGIEQGRGFQRVFGQEVGADQQPPVLRTIPRSADIRVADLFEALEEEHRRICWCRSENSAQTSSSSGRLCLPGAP